jgi:hypothetical protein
MTVAHDFGVSITQDLRGNQRIERSHGVPHGETGQDKRFCMARHGIKQDIGWIRRHS